MKKIFLVLSILISSACSDGQSSNPIGMDQGRDKTQTKYAPAGDSILVEDLRKDLTELNALLDSVHPDPGFTMDVAEVKFQIDKLAKEITAPMTQLESWKYFSQLNPYFQDGHMAIFYPDYSQRLGQHMDNGGRVFPVKVNIDKSHDLYVTAVQNDDEDIKVGDKIIAINGLDAADIVEGILNRIHGDTVSNRLAIASERFAKMYWLLYGDSGYYQIDVRDHDEIKRYSVIGSNEKAAETGLEIDEFVQREVLENGIGYLRINRFYYAPEHEEAYFTFMKDSWQEFHDANVQDVIVDVRNNPGGTDHYWQQGVAPYVASEPFLFLSRFKIRMTERNLRLGPFNGEPTSIVEGSFDQLVTVEGDSGLRIPGKAYLLMGSLSYSSTILFLTALQDSGQAVIAGQSSGARSCTTGRIETSRLSGSQLEITLPTAIFTRPSGNALCHQPVKPDIFIFDDPLNPDLAVTALADVIVSRRY